MAQKIARQFIAWAVLLLQGLPASSSICANIHTSRLNRMVPMANKSAAPIQFEIMAFSCAPTMAPERHINAVIRLTRPAMKVASRPLVS